MDKEKDAYELWLLGKIEEYEHLKEWALLPPKRKKTIWQSDNFIGIYQQCLGHYQGFKETNSHKS
jgi:hypothetical protein